MSLNEFAQILEKAKREAPSIDEVAMHNWTEPLLHPQLPELIAVAKQQDLSVFVSSNLNILRREDDLLRSGLDRLAVSVSGWRQETYGYYHSGGDIETVKTNMERLASAKARSGARVSLECVFHRYRDNAEDEEAMAAFAKNLGFRFSPTWAFFTPVEKILASLERNKRYRNVPFTEADSAAADRLAVSIPDRLRLASSQVLDRCVLLHEKLPIDATGNVRLCCASGAMEDRPIGSFLTTSLEDIQKAREAQKLCDDCMAHSIPSYYFYKGEDMADLGRASRERYETSKSREDVLPASEGQTCTATSF